MREAIQSRGRLAGHPLWARVLASTELSARTVLPVVVSSAVEDREKLEGVPWLERLSLTEVVREARAASVAGLAGLLLLGASERKDEHALLASEPDHALPRAIRAVKEATPDVAVATDVCVCAYTAHGQCVLFGERGPDVPATLERIVSIALLHAGAGRAIRVLRVERQGDPERAYRSTPVMTTPRTKTRWKMKNMTTGSTIVMSVPAWMMPGSRFEWMPLNRASATESVWSSWLADR